MYKRIPKEIKEEIIEKVQSGEKVSETANMYGISAKTIYDWLKVSIGSSDISIMKYNKLKRENIELKRIIGNLTLDLSKGKKNQNY